LDALHGPAGRGVAAGEDPAAFPPTRLLAVDVRSPAEFETGHIPGAVNIPLFSNEARAAVGTAYTQKGRFEAIRLGLSHTGPGFSNLLDTLMGHGAKLGDSVLVYCWRGGMRSGSVAWLFSLCGFTVRTLEGGYRSYRRWCKTIVGNAHAPAPAPVMVLGGCTGVGKTAVLHELRRLGEQVIDLEGLANHRGSAFGAMGQAPQPSNEAFENVLALAVRRLVPGRAMWLEHEGTHVGKVLVPFGVASWVVNAPGGAMVVLEMDTLLRVKRLVEDYCSEENLKEEKWVDGLKECISAGLAKKLGGNRVKEALQLLDAGKWEEVAEMLLGYYDKLYTRWLSQTQAARTLRVSCPTAEAAANAALALQAASAPGEASEEGRRQSKDEEPPSTTCSSPSSCPAAAGPLEDMQDKASKGSETKEELSQSENVPRFEGACFCGEVKVACRGEPRSVSYCHCSICRRLSGAPFSCQALFTSEQVELTLEPGAGLNSMRTSRGVERHRCASCLAPVRATVLGGRLSAVPLGMITSWRGGGNSSPSEGLGAAGGPECLRPRHHLYYGNRVMDVRDGLPKYEGSYRPDQGKGQGILMPEAEW